MLLLLILVLGLLTALGALAPQEHWEHTEVPVDSYEWQYGQMGKQGWHAYGVRDTSDGLVIHLRRRK